MEKKPAPFSKTPQNVRYEAIQRASGSRTSYIGYETNISVRDEFNKGHYDGFRPSEKIPTKPKEIISTCREVYRKVGLIRNIIDLMADFGSQGIKLSHPQPEVQKFYRAWFKKVKGPHVTERFINLLYREGVVIIKRTTGKITTKEQRVMRATGADKLESDNYVDDSAINVTKRVIPFKYNCINPLSVEITSEELAQFTGKYNYSLKISNSLKTSITKPKTAVEQNMIESIPADIVTAIRAGANSIPLDSNKVLTYFYKKDDWQTWADPMIYAILSDIMILEKMKFADLAALDGAISQVRLWKLGDIEKGIFPNQSAVDMLNDILTSNVGGGAFDLIWGPELSVQEYKTNVHEFLGNEKYEPVMNSIFQGLGIPPTLTGAATASGFTNNYISLKTLIQRLEYGRSVVTSFWENEVEIVRQAMGFKTAPKIEFDRMVLSDEAAEKALLIQLVDRDYISVDTLVERFGESPEFEEIKLRLEEKKRKKGHMKEKAGPYHTAEKMFNYMKIALQNGYLDPLQLGMKNYLDSEFLDIEPPYKINANMGGDTVPTDSPQKGVVGQGRPINSKDSSQRIRTPKPIGSSKASVHDMASFLATLTWAKAAYQDIHDIVAPHILKLYNKDNLRKLTTEQAKTFSDLKFAVLSNLTPFSLVDDTSVYTQVSASCCLPTTYKNLYENFCSSLRTHNKKESSADELRELQCVVYAILQGENSEEYTN